MCSSDLTMPGSRAVPAFAAAGAPEFMGGPQIQPPINMMAAPMPQANAMPATLAPVTPRPEAPAAVPYSEYVKQPVKQQNTRFFKQLLDSYEAQEAAGALPKMKEGKLSRAAKWLETSTGELGRGVTMMTNPEIQTLRDETIGLIRSEEHHV